MYDVGWLRGVQGGLGSVGDGVEVEGRAEKSREDGAEEQGRAVCISNEQRRAEKTGQRSRAEQYVSRTSREEKTRSSRQQVYHKFQKFTSSEPVGGEMTGDPEQQH
jgi:hypothetical protein